MKNKNLELAPDEEKGEIDEDAGPGDMPDSAKQEG